MLTIRVYDEDPISQRREQVLEKGEFGECGSTILLNTAEVWTEYKYRVRNDGENANMELSTTALPPTALSLSSSLFSITSNVVTIFRSTKRILIQLFLPLGYPKSVDSTYLPYQLYDSLQGLCSYLRGVVSTSAVLEAAGVGNASATAISAAMTWALRDGVGMVGGLIFSFVASDAFDTHVKEWRLFADVINDVGLFLDMLAPHVAAAASRNNSKAVMVILCASTICKTMCGMSAGATKGRITHHFSINGNMADLTAKESTQETLVSLLGLLGGIALAHLLRHDESYIGTGDAHDTSNIRHELFLTWSIFSFLTIVHVWANYRAVTLLKLRTLNRERGMVALQGVITAMVQSVLHQDGHSNHQYQAEVEQALAEIPPPSQVCEPLSSSLWNLAFPVIRLNKRFDPLDYQESFLSGLFNGDRYVIGSTPQTLRSNQRILNVSLCIGATHDDELKAWVHAVLLVSCIKDGEAWNRGLLQR